MKAFSILAILGGLIVTFIGSWTLWIAHRSTEWPVTMGAVKSSQVVSVWMAKNSKYIPKINYSYSVNGIRYQGDRVAFGIGSFSTSYSFARKYVLAYPQDSKVTVHYDNANPANSVLDAGISKASLPLFVFGLGILFLGIWMRIIAWLAEPDFINNS